MASVLIAYHSLEGQTAKIAERLKISLLSRRRTVAVVKIGPRQNEGISPDYKGVILGASIHVGRHDPAVAAFIAEHKDRWQDLPSAFFSVSLSAAGDEAGKAEADRYVAELLEATAWRPNLQVTFAGALAYRKYGWLKRWFMKRLAKETGKDTDSRWDHEYTDWQAVARFAAEFDQLLAPVGDPAA